jgi:hypothetical protein
MKKSVALPRLNNDNSLKQNLPKEKELKLIKRREKETA